MMSEPTLGMLRLVRKLDSIFALTEAERQALLALPMQVRELRTDQDLVREGDKPSQCCVLLEGFAFRYKLVGDGKRQILSFHIPGDVPDLLSLHLATMDHSLGTLAPSRVGFLTHDTVRHLIRTYPRIGDALWRDTLIDAAVFREWMVGIGRRNAYSRIAHLFCELTRRMQAIGLANGSSFRLPLTQTIVGDALGLSTVHVNRVVQQMRADGLITWEGKLLTVSDWDGLQLAGEFDPAYLHLAEARAA
jgi:CRP-like cAMP-binding protein